jgi:drug/metabolite transporter (DMT)-like permease
VTLPANPQTDTRTDLPRNPLRGIALKVLSVTLFTLMAICIKAVAPDVPPGQAVFFRSTFAIPVILAWLVYTHDIRHGLDTQNPMGHLWRGLVGVTAMGLGFTALGLLPLPEAVALGYAAPLLAVIFAAMFLGEEVRAFRLTAVVLGLVGVVIVLAPRLTLTSLEVADKLQTIGAMAAILGAVFAALAQVFVRKLVYTEATAAIVFYFSLTAAVLSLATIPFGWVVPTATQAALLIGAGLLGGIAQILLTEAYRHADVSVIAPFEYASMLLAIVFGYWLFAEVPTLTMLAGAALIVAAGLFIIWREHKLGLERGRARRAITPQG